MKSVSLKLPDALDAKLETMARRRRVPKSAIIRDAIAAYDDGERSALDLVRDLAGSIHGPDDLSTNPDHLVGLGE